MNQYPLMQPLLTKKKMIAPRLLIILVALLTIPFIPATAESVVLEPVKDNTIFSENNNSDGSGPTFFAGRIRRSNSFRRALIAFDLAGSIPEGSTIQTVTLSIRVDRDPAGLGIYALHRLTRDWGEGNSNAGSTSNGQGVAAQSGVDATWNEAFSNGEAWTSPGGDFISQATATSSVGGVGFADWSSSGLVADVQNWLDSPSTNFGWILLGSEGSTVSVKRFSSRNGSSANRPTLTVEFTPGQTGCQDVFCGEDIPGFPGWRASPWYLNYNVDFLPWIFHDEHSWQFLSDTSTEEVIFVWDLGLGEWVFLNENSYRWIFLFGGENAGWVFTFDDNTPDRRFFQRLDDGSLFSVPPGLPTN